MRLRIAKSITIYESFHITGRGIVWTLSMKANNSKREDFQLGGLVKNQFSDQVWKIQGIEGTRNSAGFGDNIGLVVIEYNEKEETDVFK